MQGTVTVRIAANSLDVDEATELEFTVTDHEDFDCMDGGHEDDALCFAVDDELELCTMHFLERVASGKMIILEATTCL